MATAWPQVFQHFPEGTGLRSATLTYQCNSGYYRLLLSSCTRPFHTRWLTKGQCRPLPCSTVRSATAKQSALLSQWPRLVVITETRGPHEYVPVSASVHDSFLRYEDQLIQIQSSSSLILSDYYDQSTMEMLLPSLIPTTTNPMMKRRLI